MAPKKKTAKKSAPKKGKLKPRGKAFPKLVPENTAKRQADIAKFKKELKKEPPKEIDPYSSQAPNYKRRGRPRMYETPEEFDVEVDGYFVYIQGKKEVKKTKVATFGRKGYEEIEEEVWVREPEPATINGLALYLGFSCRQSLDAYANDYPEFSGEVKRAKARVAGRYERNLHGGQSFGSTFALKNIDKWEDKTQVETDNKHEHVIEGFDYVLPTPPPDLMQPDPRDPTNNVTKS